MKGQGLQPRELFDLTLGTQDSKLLCLPGWQLGFSPSPLLTLLLVAAVLGWQTGHRLCHG